MAADHELERVVLGDVIALTQYWYALVILLVFFAVAAASSIITAKREALGSVQAARGPGGKPLPVTKKRKKGGESHLRRGPRFSNGGIFAFRILSFVIVLTFAASSGMLISHAFWYSDARQWAAAQYWWWCGESAVVYLAGVGFLYVYFLITLFEWKQVPTIAHLLAWFLSLVAELVLFSATFVRAVRCEHLPDRGTTSIRNQKCINDWEQYDLALYATRIVTLFVLVLLFVALWVSNWRAVEKADRDESAMAEQGERAPLLNGNVNGNGAHKSYSTQRARSGTGRSTTSRRLSQSQGGRMNGHPAQDPNCACKEEQVGFYRPEKLPRKSWYEYASGYSIFFPYLWPKDALGLQVIVVLCFILLIAQRVVNILVPIQVGVVTDALIPKDGESVLASFTHERFPLGQLLILGLLWGLQGSGGLLASVRALLWIKVSQYSYRGLTSAAFEHVHSLSLDFHLGKRTGEVLSALNKGASINQFLEQMTFNVLPMFVDLLLAIYFFWLKFGPTFAILIGVNTFWYLYLTVRMAQTRAEQRREMTNADREEEAVKNDSITSYETVKYFNAEDFEFNRYRTAIKDFQRAEAQVSRGTSAMSIVQAIVYNGGRVCATVLGAWETSLGVMTVGGFSTLLAYLAQLQGPLNFFGTFYRQVQQAMISGERLLELFKIQPSVTDAPHVKKLEDCQGKIRWSDVSFAYENRKPALTKINFECEPGTTTAFVGESGGGKSTVFRLMFRYYNSSDGSIEIDGHDVKDLTIDSVRSHIGVVPQDTTLFNDTLMFNLRYANQKATDQEIHDACRAASIHDRIMSFPDGYNTKVGERGLRLSGGEKQRVAIARTILKNPKIIMLDEATSALDTNTEQQIQDKLGNLGEGRTLLIIAHRLSTITHANQIVVLHGGVIAEKGTHEDLLAKGGRYKQMWEKQIRAERAAQEAAVASRKAQRLMRQANIGSKKTSDAKSDGYNSNSSSQLLSGGFGAKDKDLSCSAHDSPSSSSHSSDNESTHSNVSVHSHDSAHEASPRNGIIR